MNRQGLYRDVHYLAFHYHWSEGQVLRLSRSKRLRYLSMLADQLERTRREA